MNEPIKDKILFDNTKRYGGFEIWYGQTLFGDFREVEEWYETCWGDNLGDCKALLIRKGKEFFLETESFGGKRWVEKLKTPFRIEL